MALLEREAELRALRAAVADAGMRRGSVVVIIGEAGIGKTSLVQALRDDPGTECRVAIGLCDDLLTRRTLGPFHDIATHDRSAVSSRGRSPPRTALPCAMPSSRNSITPCVPR